MAKKILITGVSRGIGLETARFFLERGWQVIGTSTSGKAPLAHKCLSLYALDLSNNKSISAFSANLSAFDVLLNNAAVLLEEWDESQMNLSILRETFDINVFGTIQLTEQCLGYLPQGGQIVNVSSGWGSITQNDSALVPHYKMSKLCLNMYTRLLSERCPDRVVSSFDPGWVKTDMGTEFAPREPADVACELFDLIIKDKPSGIFWKEGKARDW